MFKRFLSATLLLAGGLTVAGWAAGDSSLPLLFRDDFEKESGRWQPTDAKAWRIIETDRSKVLSHFRPSKYEPPYRSPLNISLVKDLAVGEVLYQRDIERTPIRRFVLARPEMES